MKKITLTILYSLLGFNISAMAKNNIITHSNSCCLSFNIQEEIKRVKNTNNLVLPLEETLQLLLELNEFDLGRFLLHNKGLNGYWTSYLILRGVNKNVHALESWLIHRSPSIRAMRERFYIFQDKVKSIIDANPNKKMSIASAPCGLMDDLLSINFKNKDNIELTGIDLDDLSINMAELNLEHYNNKIHTKFLKRDAWNLDFNNQFDILLSNGLNIYESDEDRLILLYKEFYKSLKPGGTLITSFLTYPPILSKDSPWQNVDEKDKIKQAAIFQDIIGVNWSTYRTENQVREHLVQAGFTVEEVIYDSQHIFPTVVARK